MADVTSAVVRRSHARTYLAGEASVVVVRLGRVLEDDDEVFDVPPQPAIRLVAAANSADARARDCQGGRIIETRFGAFALGKRRLSTGAMPSTVGRAWWTARIAGDGGSLTRSAPLGIAYGRDSGLWTGRLNPPAIGTSERVFVAYRSSGRRRPRRGSSGRSRSTSAESLSAARLRATRSAISPRNAL